MAGSTAFEWRITGPHISLIQGLSPGLCVNESPVRFHACTSSPYLQAGTLFTTTASISTYP